MWPRRREEPGPAATDRLVELYGAYGGIVYARCRHMLGDEAAAEDATQETFLRVHRHLDDLPEPDRVLPWLYRIATNLCLNAIRDRRARPLLFEVPPERATESLQELLADRDLAARLIGRAPPKVRAAAWLCYVDGLGQEEAAEVLRVSRRTVATRLAEFTSQSRKFLSRSAA